MDAYREGSDAQLNPTEGHNLAGVKIDDHRFMARVKPAQLFQMVVNPMLTEHEEEREKSRDVQASWNIRRQVQRLFEGAKEKNVGPYARYICELAHNQDGLTPVIELYAEKPLKTQIGPYGTGWVQVPFELRFVAIDGETQLAARIEAASMDAATKDAFVPVSVIHGRSIDFARQCFHDLNLLGVRPNTAVGLSMDARDPITAITRDVAERVPIFVGRVEFQRRQLRRKDKALVTLPALRNGCVTFCTGIQGVKYGAKPVPPEDLKKTNLETYGNECISWWKAFTNRFGPALENREQTVIGAPAMLAAAGAVGHQVLLVTEAGRDAERKRLIESLAEIRWERGEHWFGVIGKPSKTGQLAIAGSKEIAYATYAALSDTSYPLYKQIRSSSRYTHVTPEVMRQAVGQL
jgi:DGQHR domain-containing protein